MKFNKILSLVLYLVYFYPFVVEAHGQWKYYPYQMPGELKIKFDSKLRKIIQTIFQYILLNQDIQVNNVFEF